MTIAPTSTDDKIIKVKRLKEDMFCLFAFFFGLNFVLWWVLF
jgi:hypothetical protein